AKSQLLQFISKIAPKARLVSGKGASSAGLTATVVKDEFLRGWALEAGAFVLANGGFAIIDEMDKINQEDTAALHQALEQQIITIAKANIQATLRAKTTLLAAANPKLGRFDPYIPIASQINMPATLINRFDLIFPIRDIPSKEFDTRVATHVLALQQNPDDVKAEFPPEFLKKYISYARQRINPVLTKEAVDEIKTFYVNLRNLPSYNEQELKPIPISARQLEALVRLSEGSARVRLSKKVTKKDALHAIETLKRCLMQVGFDPESGQIDIDRISTGISTSQRSKIVKIQALINELTKKVGKRIPVDDIIMEASEQGISEEQVNEALDILKRDGTIYQPQPNIIEKI
ncbi:MAG: minichromosome maintenance protein MCM, partial [Nanoarchaeota archaeon]